MWVEYNPNPMVRRTIDCTVRALCRVTGMTWDEVKDELAMLSKQMCTMEVENEVWGAFLRHRGWRRYAIPNSCPDCYTAKDFAEDHPRGAYVLGCHSHVIAVVDGDWYDTFDSAQEVPVVYWVKER